MRFMIFYLKRKFKTSIVPIPGRPKIAETLAVIKFKGSEKPVSAERLSSITSEVTPLAVLKIDFIIGCLDFKIILIMGYKYKNGIAHIVYKNLIKSNEKVLLLKNNGYYINKKY